MKKKRSKLISMLLTLVMTLSLVPAMGVTASAAEWTTVNTYKELQDAVKAKKEYIKLGQDIDTTNFHSTGSGLEVEDWLTFENQTCTLDLNGKTLTLMTRLLPMGVFLRVYDGSNLTIKDSSSANTGAITGAFKNYIASDAGCCLFHVHGGSSLTLENGSFTVTSEPHESNTDTVRAMDSNITIKEGVTISHPGKFYPEHSYKDLDGNSYALRTDGKCKVIIDGGVFDGHVKLSGYQDTNGSIQINKGTFKKDVQVLYTAEENNSNPAVTVNGGTFEGNVYLQYWPWKTSLYMPYRLNGGTFKGTVDLYADDGIFEKDKPTGNPNIALGLDKCFGYSAVVTPGGTFTGPNAYTGVLEKFTEPHYEYYEMWLKGSASKPVRIIPNAWGMKSVTLDGTKPINYAKDWYDAAVEITNDTAHTIKFEWKDLAPELSAAGYSYNATCDRYISGSTTPTTDTISATDIEYRFTIDKDAPAKVYSFDLHLNLKKTGSPYNIGIMGNEHIVKLVVSEAPVVTEISSAPVRLSAALTPDSTAPSATAVGSGYTVDSIKWYTDNNCTEQANSFEAGKVYYGKIVLKPEKNYKFAASASALFFCDDPNENYVGISSTVAEDGSSLTRVVKGKAVSALVWDSVDTNNQTYTIGDSALMLNAKATGGDSGKPIIYKLIAEKDGTETVKASATVAASLTDGFSAPLGFTETGTYHCRFEATRGGVTISSEPFTVTVNAPGLSITNQSGNLTVKQNATARLFVKAVGHGVNYQWQVKNDGTWEAISDETDYDYAAPTDEVGEKTYKCKVTDKYGEKEFSDEMTVTVTEGADMTLTPAILLAAVNGDAPDPAKLWSDKSVPPSIWLSLSAEYNVTAGETFNGVATFSTIPTGFTVNGRDIYYDSYNGIQKTPVLGTISYEWKGTKTPFATATDGDFKSLGTDAHASFEIPSGVDTYYVKLSVKNKIDDGAPQESTVNITFHVSPAHTHSYAYAQLNKDQHTKYCTAGDYSTTENHDMDIDNGVCKLCGYAPAKTYTVNVTNGSANPNADVTPGTKVTLTADNAPTGQEFDKWVGNVAVASDHTFNMPSHNVTVAATYKPITHTHDYTGQNWAPLNDEVHSRSCKAGDFMEFEDHNFKGWKKVDDNKHNATCSECGYEKTENHSWVLDSVKDPTFTAEGSRNYKCSANGCTATKTESIPKLTAISAVNVTVSAPIKDAVPGTATTMDTTYDVAATDWDPIVSSTFAGGTEYTVKVSLEARDNNRFTNATAFLINGQKATIVGTQPTATGVEDTKITLTFPATEGGSTSGGSSSGGGGGVTKYAVAVSPADNGKVTSDKTRAAKDSVVTITTKTNDGYALDTIKATDKAGKEIKLTDKGDGKYTFTMPASKVEVKAAFKQTASKPGKPAEEMKTVVVMQVGSKTMFVNGKAYEKDAAPVIMNDRTLVPIRFVTESLGGTVAWNAETKEVTLVIDGKEIKMTIGKTIEKYGVAPVIIDSRTFVPVRFVADELGATTAWNAETKTVTITKAVTPVKTEK